MLAYTLKKGISALITLWVIATLTFFMLRWMPGGPFDQERQLPATIQANLNARFHLDKPLVEQYNLYLGGLINGDLGPSYKFLTRRVRDIVIPGLWVSAQLGLLALILGCGLGLIMGTWTAMAQSAWKQSTLTMLGILSLSMPTFIWGALMVFVFCYGLGWLPAARWVSPWHMILPTLTLAIFPFSSTFFLFKTTMTDMARQPFVRIKQSFGLGEHCIVWKHQLKASLIPFLSLLGPLAAALITGSFAVEWLFAIPGLGKFFINGVINRDYTLVMGITLIYALILISFNLLTDLALGWVDPRLAQNTGGGK